MVINRFILLNYIKKLTKDDILVFCQKQNISLTKEEVEVIYFYIKNRYLDFFRGKDQEILSDIKKEVSDDTYLKILEYYQLYVDKIR